MSRKRERSREDKKELARQVGGRAEDVPAELREHARVCTPTLRPTLAVQRQGLGLLRRKGPLSLHLALYLVDRAGVRLVRRQTLTGPPAAEEGDEERVRYTRPAHFLLVALLTEGATAEQVR